MLCFLPEIRTPHGADDYLRLLRVLPFLEVWVSGQESRLPRAPVLDCHVVALQDGERLLEDHIVMGNVRVGLKQFVTKERSMQCHHGGVHLLLRADLRCLGHGKTRFRAEPGHVF